jgi:hypothetical protein
VVRVAIEEPPPPYGIVLAFRVTSVDGTDLARGGWFDHRGSRCSGFPLSNDRREELVDEMSWNGGGSVSIASIRDCQARRMSYDIEVSPIPDQATVERTIGPVSVWPEPYWQLSIRQPDDD